MPFAAPASYPSTSPHALLTLWQCETAVLHVKLLNDAAVKFYERYGFHSDPEEVCCELPPQLMPDCGRALELSLV